MKKKQKVENELQHLRAFVETRFAELKAELRRVVELVRGTAAAHAAPPTRAVTHKAPAKSKSPRPRNKPKIARDHHALTERLKAHKHHKVLVRAGKQRDQLLRSLIPLYLARDLADVDVNSGSISTFWKFQGVNYAGPNAAKALRAHVGYANKSGRGWAISPSGVKYVDAALAKALAA